MKIIFGLGNPASEYGGTRHNVGFAVLDAYAKEKSTDFQEKSKHKALIAETDIAGEKLLLVKPMTYYNLVGESLRSLLDFYKLEPADVLLIHDDLALPFGTLRTRIGGSDAGSNGLKSIIQHGAEASARLRIGITNELRSRMDDADFVLSRFTATEVKALQDLQPKIAEIIDDFIAGDFDHTTHR